MQKGTIEISLEPFTPVETERLRRLIETVISSGVFAIKNGNATLHFDAAGELRLIETNMIRFKR